MRRAPQDHQKAKGAFDASKYQPESVGEFFDFTGPNGAERGEKKVRRYELLAILTQIERGKRELAWWRRLWRYLTSHLTWAQTGMTNPTTVQDAAAVSAKVWAPEKVESDEDDEAAPT